MGCPQRSYSLITLATGLLVGSAGLAFYGSNALVYGVIADLPLSFFANSVSFRSAFLGSFPSFVHALASSLLIASCISVSTHFRFSLIAFILAANIGLEAFLGTFDILDSYALLIGTMLGSVALLFNNGFRAIKPANLVPVATITVACLVFSAGSYMQQPGCARYSGSQCVQSKRFANPKYMSYNELRNAVKLEQAHDLTSIERVYLYKSLIFVNEANEGIHIIDNRFPANPTPMGFIRIPGNLEINIKGDFLYADSYIDLVTIDLSDVDNIREVNRDIDIFPYNAFQNIPNDIDFRYESLDESRGVVIGYE